MLPRIPHWCEGKELALPGGLRGMSPLCCVWASPQDCGATLNLGRGWVWYWARAGQAPQPHTRPRAAAPLREHLALPCQQLRNSWGSHTATTGPCGDSPEAVAWGQPRERDKEWGQPRERDQKRGGVGNLFSTAPQLCEFAFSHRGCGSGVGFRGGSLAEEFPGHAGCSCSRAVAVPAALTSLPSPALPSRLAALRN